MSFYGLAIPSVTMRPSCDRCHARDHDPCVDQKTPSFPVKSFKDLFVEMLNITSIIQMMK